MAIGTVRDDSDLSATFYLGRDDKNLYIMGRIKDDSLVTTEKRDMIYKDDCVEIFFDTNNDGYYFDRNPHDYQLGIAPYGPERDRRSGHGVTLKKLRRTYLIRLRLPRMAISWKYKYLLMP